MQVGDLITFHESGMLATIIKTGVGPSPPRLDQKKELVTIYLVGGATKWNPTTVTMKYLIKTAEVVNESR